MTAVVTTPPAITALQGQYRAKLDEAKRLLGDYEDKPAPKDVLVKAKALHDEADGIASQIELAQRAAKGDQYLNSPSGIPVSHQWDPTPSKGPEPKYDRKSWREIEVDTVFGKKSARFYVPIAVEKKEYEGAFMSYLANPIAPYSINDLGPNDRKTLTEATDGAGGFLIPEDYQASIIKKIIALTAVRANARVQNTSRDIIRWPKINYSSATDDSTGNVFTSPVRMSWVGESPASSTVHRVNEPVFGNWVIPVHTAMASAPVSNDLIEDAAFDVMSTYAELFGEGFALGEDSAFLTGDGVAKPMGIVTEMGTNGPATTTTAGVGVVAGDDIVSLFYDLAAQYRERGQAKWIMSSSTMKAIHKLKDSQNRYLISSLTDGNITEVGRFRMLMDEPVALDEFAPSIATNNVPLVFGDWSGYLIVDRVGLSIRKLDELYAETNVTLLLARRRLGGYCIEPWKFRGLKVQ